VFEDGLDGLRWMRIRRRSEEANRFIDIVDGGEWVCFYFVEYLPTPLFILPPAYSRWDMGWNR
jgi:hypothetical protein